MIIKKVRVEVSYAGYAKKIASIVSLLLDVKHAGISSIKNVLRKRVHFLQMRQNINVPIVSRKVPIIIKVLII